jgi:putative ABC transport system permease protein
MLAAEGGVVGGLGSIAGLVVGAAMSLVLIHVINRQSFHWSMELHVPWLTLAGFTAGLVLCSAVTAVLSARPALGDDVVRAVKEDW